MILKKLILMQLKKKKSLKNLNLKKKIAAFFLPEYQVKMKYWIIPIKKKNNKSKKQKKFILKEVI